MKEINQTIHLQTNDPVAQLSVTCLYLVQISFTFRVMVVSGEFRGSAGFCILDSELESFSSDLHSMYSSLSGGARLTDCDSDGFLQFTASKNGHVSVVGQIGSSSSTHSIRFEFMTDQTCLLPFSQALKDLLTQTDEDWHRTS